MDLKTLVKLIQESLTPDLLKPKYRNGVNRYAGHCYVASETLYHLMGGKESGLKPFGLGDHWWLQDGSDQIIDITSAQFDYKFPYYLGRHRSFLTRTPSKRAKILMERILVKL